MTCFSNFTIEIYETCTLLIALNIDVKCWIKNLSIYLSNLYATPLTNLAIQSDNCWNQTINEMT